MVLGRFPCSFNACNIRSYMGAKRACSMAFTVVLSRLVTNTATRGFGGVESLRVIGNDDGSVQQRTGYRATPVQPLTVVLADVVPAVWITTESKVGSRKPGWYDKPPVHSEAQPRRRPWWLAKEDLPR